MNHLCLKCPILKKVYVPCSISAFLRVAECAGMLTITRRQHFRPVQIETNCRRHFKVHIKWKISTISVENIVRKGEIACPDNEINEEL